MPSTYTDLLKRILALISGSVVANLITLAATPVLSRFYTPEAFGMLAVFISASAIVGTFICLRLEQAVYVPKRHSDAHHLVGIAFLIAIVLCLMLTLMVFVLQPWLAETDLPLLFWLFVPFAGMALGLYNLLSNWSVRMQLVRAVVQTRISRALIQVCTQVSLGALGSTTSGLLSGEILGRLGGFAQLGRHFRTAWSNQLHRLTAKRIFIFWRRYWRFPVMATPAALINTCVMQSPAFFLGYLYSPAAAGFYFMAQRLVAGPMAIIGQSVAQGFTAELGRRIHHQPDGSVKLFLRTSAILLIIGGPGLLLVAWASTDILPWALGDQWAKAATYIQALIPFFISQFVISPLTPALQVLQRQSWLLGWDCCRLLLLALLLSQAYALPVESLLALFGKMMAGMYALMFVLILVALYQHQRHSKPEHRLT